MSVKLMFALSVFITYALQLYVPIQVVWPVIQKKLQLNKEQLRWEYLFRILMVLLTCKYRLLCILKMKVPLRLKIIHVLSSAYMASDNMAVSRLSVIGLEWFDNFLPENYFLR